MKIRLTIFVLLLCSIQAYPTNNPSSQTITGFSEQITIPVISLSLISNMKVKEVEKTIGRKLKLKEKIAFKIFQWENKKDVKRAKKERESDKGKTALILGICGAAALFIPFLNLASIPLAILAIIIGNKAKREDPKNRKARTGVTLGIATLAFLIVIGLIVALVLTLGAFPM
jgi:hypothetical protein